MYYVYILECADKTLYTGITTDIAKRLAAHKAGTASRYTRAHGAKRIRYQEECQDRGSALRREAAIKKLSRIQKSALIEGK
ncbi:MAG: GIY-YIG nuclease family protein [Candidatus Paceibacterota bacterium]